MSDPGQRVGAVAVLVAGLAHELRNVLAAAETSLYLAERAGDEASRVRQIAAARTSVRAAQDLVGRALLPAHQGSPAQEGSPAHGGAGTFEPLSVLALLQTTASAAASDPAVAIAVDVEPRELELAADSLLLGRALHNLVDNARQVAVSAGRARVSIRLTARAAPDGVHLSVEDDGPGTDPVLGDRLFEPLTTARPGGTGLGLAFVRAIAELHGGRVACGPSALGGASFTLVVRSPTAP